jgi:hypothetical protein
VGRFPLVAAIVLLAATGCTLRSVDKASYVARNRAVLRELPAYPGARLVNSYSVGQSATGGFPPRENGPPYDAYYTWNVYETPPGQDGGAGGFYGSVLPRRGWRWIGGFDCDSSYVRGHALVHVSCSRESNTFTLSVNYNAR